MIRVDSRRRADDIPPLSARESGSFEGGWWNYNGILREVYLRRIESLDIRSALRGRGSAAGGARRPSASMRASRT